jgi:protoporphyrinogen oxidase
MVLPDDLTVIPRSSGVYYFGRYHDWPLKLSTVFKLPPAITLKVARDLLRRRRRTGTSFEDYIITMYGATLYDSFFQVYTEKFLKHDPARIHADWAKAGIDRAVIDRRMQANTLMSLIRKTLLPAPVTTEFLYPRQGGIGLFAERLAGEIRRNRGTIILNTGVSSIRTGKKRLEEVTLSAGQSLQPDLIIWTAPINLLCRLLDVEEPRLKYLSALLYNAETEGNPPFPYQWCYYGQKEIVFNRVSIPRNFYAGTAPSGMTGIGLEVTCMEGDEVWNDPDRLRGPLVEDMVRVGLVADSARVRKIHVERIPNVYPIYELDYLQPLQRILNHLSYLGNLLLLGRTGTFWYNNMDHSIAAGLDAAEDIVSSERGGIHPLYHRNDFWAQK